MGAQSASETSSDIRIGHLVFDRDCAPEQANPAVVVNIPPKQADEWDAYGETTVAEDNPDYPASAPIIVVTYRDDLLEDTQLAEKVAPNVPIPLQELSKAGIKHYSFPAPRLRLADPETDDVSKRTVDTTDDTSSSSSSSPSPSPSPSSTSNDNSDDTETRPAEQDTDEANESESESRNEDESRSAENESDAETGDEGNEQELQQLTEHLLDNGVRSEIEDGMVVIEKLGQRYEIGLDGEVDGDGPYQDRLEQLVSDYRT